MVYTDSMNRTKKIFIFIVLLALIGFGIYQMKQNYSPLPTTPVDIDTLPKITGEDPSYKLYTDEAQFSFKYPKELESVSHVDYYDMDPEGFETLPWRTNTQIPGIRYVTVTIPDSFQQNTNFRNAVFTIGASTDAQALKECLVPTNGERAKGEATINSFTYSKITLSEGAAGNYYDTTSYRTVVSDMCFAIEYTIHSSNLRNYDPGTVGEFDTQAVVNVLEDMVQSFQLH